MTDEQDAAVPAYRQRPFPVPPGALDLLLVRHGQSQEYREDAPFSLVGGHGDPPLSDLGRQQAELVAARLAGAGIEAVYVTTLRRTAQTAAPLAARLGLTPQVEAGLREVFLGAWEGGRYRKMVAENHPVAQRMFAEERWNVIPGGEQLAAFQGRIRASVGCILTAHRPAGRGVHPWRRDRAGAGAGQRGQDVRVRYRGQRLGVPGDRDA